MGWCENKQGACCASTHCGQQMRFSWPQLWYGAREIPFTMPLSVSTNGYGRQLDAKGFISFHGRVCLDYSIEPDQLDELNNPDRPDELKTQTSPPASRARVFC